MAKSLDGVKAGSAIAFLMSGFVVLKSIEMGLAAMHVAITGSLLALGVPPFPIGEIVNIVAQIVARALLLGAATVFLTFTLAIAIVSMQGFKVIKLLGTYIADKFMDLRFALKNIRSPYKVIKEAIAESREIKAAFKEKEGRKAYDKLAKGIKEREQERDKLLGSESNKGKEQKTTRSLAIELISERRQSKASDYAQRKAEFKSGKKSKNSPKIDALREVSEVALKEAEDERRQTMEPGASFGLRDRLMTIGSATHKLRERAFTSSGDIKSDLIAKREQKNQVNMTEEQRPLLFEGLNEESYTDPEAYNPEDHGISIEITEESELSHGSSGSSIGDENDIYINIGPESSILDSSSHSNAAQIVKKASLEVDSEGITGDKPEVGLEQDNTLTPE